MADKEESERRESGAPGGGAGRKDDVGGSGVYPMSGPHPPGDAPIIAPAAWGQGARGAAGYEDHGESEINIQFVAPEKCRDLMTKDPVCGLASDVASRAAGVMAQYDIGVLPVVESLDTKKVVGIITDRDLVLRALAKGGEAGAMRLEQIMSRPVIACSPDDDVQKVLELMEQHKIKRVAAVDNSGRVVGIISQSDVALRLRDYKKTAEVIESISQPG